MNAPTPKRAHVWPKHPEGWYVEEVRATDALLSVESFKGPILDPACGQGNIVRTLAARGRFVLGCDLVRRFPEQDPPSWWLGEWDFLRAPPEGAPPFVDSVITNPPFFRGRGTEAFIRKALQVAVGKVAVWADLTFLAGDRRAQGLWVEHPPTRIWSVWPRVSCPTGDYLAAGGVAEGGTADWCWLVWDLTAPPGDAPRFGWAHAPRPSSPTPSSSGEDPVPSSSGEDPRTAP